LVHHNWVKQSEIELKKILEPYTGTKLSLGDKVTTEIRAPGFLDPAVKGITEKMTKIGFDTGIRVCYVATKDAWQMNSRRNIRLVFRQYSKPLLNSFVRTNSTQADALGGPYFAGWLLLSPKKVQLLANRMLTEYRERAFFPPLTATKDFLLRVDCLGRLHHI
jgi:hypothetical protein